MNLPCIVTICLLIIAFFSPKNMLIPLAFVLLAFGSMAIVPSDLLGGLTILSSAVAFLLIVVKVAVRRQGLNVLFAAAFDPKGMLALSAFTLLGIASAFILPRVFQNQVIVFPMAGASFPTPLQPVSFNFNQAADIGISAAVAVAFYALSLHTEFAKRFLNALLWAAASIIATGIADFLSPMLGLGSFLQEFRTASYSFMTDNTVLNVRRIIGLMTEASSFGAAAASTGALVLYCRHAYSKSVRNRIALPLAAGCLVFAALSTSTTAYFALAVVIAVQGLDYLLRLFGGARRDKISAVWGMVGAVVLGLVGLCVIVGADGFRQAAFDMIDATVFKKNQSTSFAERSSWNHYALGAFSETGGIGVGIGSVRTSNFFINILASTGLLGTLLFGIFLWQVFVARVARAHENAYQLAHGLKLGLIVMFAGLLASGTTPDYGVFIGACFGTIMGLARGSQLARPVTQPNADAQAELDISRSFGRPKEPATI